MASRTSRTPSQLSAFVLHHYDWSESSVILDLFTREQGRLAVAAKGAKRPYSQFRAVLLPFQRITVSLGRGAGEEAPEVQSLRAAEWAGGTPMLTGSALFSGFYLNELLLKLLARHDAHPAVFDAYAGTLEELGNGDDAAGEVALRAFELKLLEALGVLPDLSVVTATQLPVEPERRHALQGEAGLEVAGRNEPGLEGRALVALQAALEHGSLEALRQACRTVLADLKPVLRAQLHYHLGSSTLRTRQVMIEAQGLER